MPKKIEYKGSNVYVLRVPVGRNEHGNVQTKNQTITAESLEDAEVQYIKFEALVKSSDIGSEFKPPETVADLVEHWFYNVMRISSKKTTAATNRRISTRVVEALGHLKIKKVTYLHLNKFTAQLQMERNRNNPDKFLSERTIRMHQEYLKQRRMPEPPRSACCCPRQSLQVLSGISLAKETPFLSAAALPRHSQVPPAGLSLRVPVRQSSFRAPPDRLHW